MRPQASLSSPQCKAPLSLSPPFLPSSSGGTTTYIRQPLSPRRGSFLSLFLSSLESRLLPLLKDGKVERMSEPFRSRNLYFTLLLPPTMSWE